jgi:uncharacterized phiE125 gp8 family phage protein
MSTKARLKPEKTIPPTAEPVSLAQLKLNLSVPASDTAHDDRLMDNLRSARDQWERDTDRALCFQTWRVKTPTFYDKLELPKSPIHSITSITYFDTANASQTLSASLYQLDVDCIRIAYNATIPSTVSRWDAWTITYKCGFSQDGSLVPPLDKRAIMLLASYYFENPDMLISDSMKTQREYEALVTRAMRSSYP